MPNCCLTAVLNFPPDKSNSFLQDDHARKSKQQISRYMYRKAHSDPCHLHSHSLDDVNHSIDIPHVFYFYQYTVLSENSATKMY